MFLVGSRASCYKNESLRLCALQRLRHIQFHNGDTLLNHYCDFFAWSNITQQSDIIVQCAVTLSRSVPTGCKIQNKIVYLFVRLSSGDDLHCSLTSMLHNHLIHFFLSKQGLLLWSHLRHLCKATTINSKYYKYVGLNPCLPVLICLLVLL